MLKPARRGADYGGMGPPTRLVLLVFLLGVVGTADAELYRCEEPDGTPRFTSDPHRCPGSPPHRLERVIQTLPPHAPKGDVARSATPAARQEAGVYRGDLQAVFVPASALGEHWEVVEETPVDPLGDPELRESGVRATRAQHYTRPRTGGAQVCSVEIWAFGSAEQARRVRQQIDFPGWRFARRANLLVMLRGVTLDRASGFQKGLLPECQRLGELTEARATALVAEAEDGK